MRENKIFLQAHWNYLILANYVVPKAVLTAFLPKACELALWENQAFVSLVGFQFNRTKVFGIRWPGFTNFLEINLRFYVYYQDKRAVCFIKEYVPSYMIAGIARALYHEPYTRQKITNKLHHSDKKIQCAYQMHVKNHPFTIKVMTSNHPYLPDANSVEHFFKEYDLGVGRARNKDTLIYRVKHPEWKVFPIDSSFIELDWEFFFGSEFAFLKEQQAHSVFFAEGSPVTVYHHSLSSGK